MAPQKFSDGTSSGISGITFFAVWGDTKDGYGVVGTSANSTGVYGESINGTGVYGRSDKPGQVEDDTLRVYGENGVFGENNQVLGIGVRANASGNLGVGVRSTGEYAAILAEGSLTSTYGIWAISRRGTGALGESDSGIGVEGSSNSSDGVSGSSVSGIGVSGVSFGNAAGVSGESDSGNGVTGESNTGIGVHGSNNSLVRLNNRPGVRGDGVAEDGVWAISQHANGIYAVGGKERTAYAAWLDGQVYIRGPLFKPGGGFQIDHPRDPGNKYLNHAFVESADMKNIYDGVVVLDAKGQAEVALPAWFDALNDEFRYQVTPIGASAPSLHIAQEIANNRFRIAGGAPGMKISWQVTGVRVDVWATVHRIPVEQEKPAEERGRYLHPELYNQVEEKAVDWNLRSAARARPRPEKDLSKRLETLKRKRRSRAREREKFS